jgi:glycogen operon protein
MDQPRFAAPDAALPDDVRSGSGLRLGAHWTGAGVEFGVFSHHAERVELCLFDEAGREVRRLALPERDGDVWHGFVPGLAPGALYGLRAHGPYEPQAGHRFNPHKLLIDPYARALSGALLPDDALYGYIRGHADGDLSYDTRDSAPFVPKAVVTVAPPRAPGGPATPWGESLIYEAHVKGLTQRWPDVDPAVRGTYAALGSAPVIAHLRALGVTAVELLPVAAFADEPFLAARGLTNYWGYNPLAFGVPTARYGPPEALRAAIARLHAAGIEVILDVVFNHAAEGDRFGPTLSFRGLDNASYYRLQPRRPRMDVDDSGCGNTLNVAHPFVLRLVLDSLRHWVEAYGVDGFRFDLGTLLAREPAGRAGHVGAGGFDPDSGFLDALRQDPVLSRVKLIMEPWDLGHGGYRLGGFPPGIAEWNDRFRDDVRRFWRGDAGAAPQLAKRLLGSAEVFDTGGRRSWTSINFLTAHDGFTLADLTAYSRRHNEANGEGNRDGRGENFSDNLGVEGPSEDADLRAARDRRRRALLATLFLSQGTPMLLAGDEIANSQGGNNNAYCQDNPIGWLDWDGADAALLAFVRRLAAFRRAHPALRQTRFLHAGLRPDGRPDVAWYGFDGNAPAWDDPALDAVSLRLSGSAEAPDVERPDEDLLIALNAGDRPRDAVLPVPPEGAQWRRLLDSAEPEAEPSWETGAAAAIGAQSIAVFGVQRKA